MDLGKLQTQLKPWVQHNFGDRPSWQPLLGLQEELGELSHAYLKREQRIRTNEDHEAGIRDAVADLVIFLADFCNAEGIDLAKEVYETWVRVSKRDWKANSETAAARPAAPDSPRDLIAELRGGAPEACDWCGKTSEQLEPVSGDQWVCRTCLHADEPESADAQGDADAAFLENLAQHPASIWPTERLFEIARRLRFRDEKE